MYSKLIIVNILITFSIATHSQQIVSVDLKMNSENRVDWCSVTVTNQSENQAIAIENIDIKYQLEDLRYFYHGVYGNLRKSGENYELITLSQQLSRPLCSMLLLPKQSVSWERWLRSENYMNISVTYRVLPIDSVSKSVYFEKKNTQLNSLFVPLQKSDFPDYVEIAKQSGIIPLTFVENYENLKQEVANLNVKMYLGKKQENSFEVSIPKMKLIATYNGLEIKLIDSISKQKLFEKIIIYPEAMDLILQFLQKSESIPFLLNKEMFSDIVNVNVPKEDMYFDPGINAINYQDLLKIFKRSEEKKAPIKAICIDSNGLGKQYVLFVGERVSKQGRRGE